MPRHLQTSFGSGEISPALHARTDLERFLSAAKTCRNFFPKPQGGAANRPGTQFLGYTRGEDKARLIPFSYSTDQTYAVEFGTGWLRWYTQGRRVSLKGTAAAISNGDFVGGISPWSGVSTGGGSSAGANTQRIITSGTPIGDMTDGPGLGNAFNGITDTDSDACPKRNDSLSAWIGKDWGSGNSHIIDRFKLVGSRDRGFKTGGNPELEIRLEGSDDNFATVVVLYRQTVTDENEIVVDRSAAIIKTTAYRYHRVWITGGGDDEDTFVAELSFYEIAGSSGAASLIGNGTGIAAIQQSVTVPSGNLGQEHGIRFQVIGNPGEKAYIRIGKTAGGAEILNDRVAEVGWHVVSFVPSASPMYIRFLNFDATTVKITGVALVGSGASTTSAVEIVSPYAANELAALNYTQSADVLTLVHPAHPPRELRRYGPYSWSLVDLSFAPQVATPTAAVWSVTKIGTGTSNTYKYQITYETESGEESLPAAEKSLTNDPLGEDNKNEFAITFPYPAGVVKVNVYKYKGGRFGFIGSSDDGYFIDEGIAAEVDITPPRARNPFTGAGNYPSAVGYWEQRQWMGGTDNAPDTFEGSQAGAYRNFSKSEPLQDSDAITLTPASREVNRIRHLLGTTGLWVLTSGAVWRVERGDQGVTPANEGGLRKLFPYGSDLMPPLEIGKSVVFVQEHGRAVRDLIVDAVSEGFSEDLSQLAAHLLHGRKIVDWCWQGDPFGVVWIVRDDGLLLSLTYDRDQKVLGWAQHDTFGQFVSVCCISEPQGDAVYAVVRRYLQGEFRYMVERFASRIITQIEDSHFVDAGIIYTQSKPIIGLTLSPLTVKATSHGCVAGDLVDFASMGPTHEWRGAARVELIGKYLGGKRFKCASVAGDWLNLVDQYTGAAVDTTGWPDWLEGGVVRKAVSTVTGLAHLEGESVAILADGNVEPAKVVSGGAVTLNRPASRVHVGLPYSADLGLLPIPLAPELFGRRKRVTEVNFWLSFTRGCMAGPDENSLGELKWRTTEQWDQTTAPRTGYLANPVRPIWGDAGEVLIRQVDPLPCEVLAVERVYDAGGG